MTVVSFEYYWNSFIQLIICQNRALHFWAFNIFIEIKSLFFAFPQLSNTGISMLVGGIPRVSTPWTDKNDATDIVSTVEVLTLGTNCALLMERLLGLSMSAFSLALLLVLFVVVVQ